MNDLYLANEGEALHVGTLIDVDQIDDWYDLSRMGIARCIFAEPSGTVRTLLLAALSTGAAMRFAWGQENSMDAPTGVSDGLFVLPDTRTWFRIHARVHAITWRKAESGPQTILHLDMSGLVQQPMIGYTE